MLRTLHAPAPAAEDELIVLGTRRPLGEYLAELWRRRHFAKALADNDLRVQHMNSVLGQLWHLLNPALMIFVYFLIFGVVLDARRGVDNYITFLVTGVVVFRLAQNGIIGCARCIPMNLGLIRSIQFPRALVPVAIVLQSLMAVVPALCIVIVVAFLNGADVTWRLLLLPGVIGLGAVFILGVGLAAARAGSSLTDLTQVLPHFFRIMLYVSGVLFSVQASIDNQLIRNLFALNPFYCFVAMARWSVMNSEIGERVVYGMIGWAIGSLIIGFVYFRRAEHRFGA